MCYGSFCFTLDLTSCSGVGASAGQVLTDLFSAVPPRMSQVGDTTKKIGPCLAFPLSLIV